ncbi:D-tyrosyl-tRNA(Tyr) deacylase [archaeon]|nr:D-tyrosyl-tRNA(Tyr) deacylase [archaeon]
MKGIIFSHQDKAGKNIADALLEKGFEETDKTFGDCLVYKMKDMILTSIKEDIIYPTGLDKLAQQHQLDVIIMASRHKSKSGKPTLTVHPTGNYGEAKYGGKAGELQKTNANTLRNIYLQLLNETPDGYDVSLEATHHGPTEFNTPLIFAELGSSEKQWADANAADFLAEAIIQGLQSKGTTEVVIGFGGNHYAKKFSKMEEDIAFSHICPKYAIDLLDQNLVKQMIEKTEDNVQQAILDEKNMKGAQKSSIKMYLENLGIDF